MTRPHASGGIPSRRRGDVGLHAGRTARRARAHRSRPGRAGADVDRRPGRVRRRSSGGGAAAAGPGDDGGDRRRRGEGRHELRGRRGRRSRARRAVGDSRRLAPRRLDGGRTPVAPRLDGRCPHRRACAAAGRGAGGGDAAGARPPRLLQPGVADLPLRRRRRRAACRARRRLRAGRGAGGVAAAGHRPRRAAGAGLAGRYPCLGGRAPYLCAARRRRDRAGPDRPQPGHGPGDAAGGLRAGVRGRVAGGWRSAGRAARPGRDARAHHLWAAAASGGHRRGSRLACRRELRVRPRRRRGQRLPAGAARHRCGRSVALALRRRAVVPVARGPDALGRRPGAGGGRAGAGGGGRGLGAAAAAVRGGDGSAGGRRRLVPTLALSATAAVGRASGPP